MSDRWFAKKPCKHCPFLRSVPPFLHPHRAAEISKLSWNPYNEFYCHKTLEHDDEGDTYADASSLMCAGFLTMQIEYGGASCPEGFAPSEEVYSDPDEMIEAYTEAWEANRHHARRGA